MRLFIGFDIGDAESIVEMAVSASNDVQPATMPGKNTSGQAIPTLYAYDEDGNSVFADQVAADYDDLTRVEMNFKRQPSSLLTLSDGRISELLCIDPHKLMDEPEFQSGPIREFAAKLCTFVNLVLTNDSFVERARAFAVNCDDCVICVGHPTNWNALDHHIYEAILQKSVIGEETYIGLPISLSLEYESRAAFLYIKNTYAVKLADGEFVGLMDVGSSTIDISVLTKNSRDCVYDSGSNFLGARGIDYLILEYYISEIEKDPQDGMLLKNILENNRAAFRSLLINCRFAKEQIFSNSSMNKSKIKAKILFGDFRRVWLTWETLVEDICSKRPVAPVLTKYCALPNETARELGDRSWIMAFREFVRDQIHAMEKQGIVITKMFLTGSASRMEFVRAICKELIPQLNEKNSLFDDTNPSNAIANGLARVGASEIKAADFMADMKNFLDEENGQMHTIITRRIPDLIQDIADPIAGAVQDDIVIPAICKWKARDYKSLNNMLDAIQGQCKDKEKFNKILSENQEFSDAVSGWMVNKVGHDIAVALQGIAHKHQVYDFTIDQLNAFKTLKIGMGGDLVNTGGVSVVTKFPADQIAYAIAAVVGVVSFFVIPYVTGFVLGLVSFLFETLAVHILVTLMANPVAFGVSVVAIAALLGVGVVKGYKENKSVINDWLLKQNFPKPLRNTINVSKLAEEMKKSRAEMVVEISKGLNNSESVKSLSKGIYGGIYSQVEERANQIRYEIESR